MLAGVAAAVALCLGMMLNAPGVISEAQAQETTVSLVANDALIIDTDANDTGTVTLNLSDQPAGEYADVTFNLDGSLATFGSGGDYTLAITRDETAVKQTSSADGIAGDDFVPVASGEQTFRIPANTGSVVFTVTPVVDSVTEGDESVVIRVTRVNFEGTSDFADLTLAAVILVKDAATGICGRTAEVQTAIIAEIPDTPACGDVTPAQLAVVNPNPGNFGLNLDGDLNSTPKLKSGDFAGLTGLRNLDLGDNALTELPEGVFAGLTSLQTLELRINALTELPAGVIAGLANLQRLGLFGNALTELPEGVFASLTGLQNLGLGNNALTELPEGVFAGLTSLRDLHLNDNALTELPEGVFAGLTSLQELRLEGNALTELPSGVFAGLTSLRTLGLSGNALTELAEGVFAGLTSLQNLWLRHNDLTELPEGVFAGLTSLQVLWLNNNDLPELPEGVFAGLNSLQTLNLGVNNFTARTATHPGGLPSGIFDDVLDTVTRVATSNLDVVIRGGLFVDANGRAAHSVCSRTAVVRDAIAPVGVTDCLRVSTVRLAAVTRLSVSGLNVSPRVNDLDGLDALTSLTLAGSFTSLPEGALDDVLDTLTALTLPATARATVSITPAISDVVPGMSRNFSATLDRPLPYPLRLTLTAGGTLASEITAPASVTIPAGMKYAGFTVTLDADATLGNTGTVAPGSPALLYTPEGGPEEDLAAFIEDALMNVPVALHTLTAATEASDDSAVNLVANDASIVDTDANDTGTATLILNDQPVGEYADVTFNLDGSLATFGSGGDYTLAITRGGAAVKQTSSADGIVGADFVPVASGDQTFRIPADTGSVVFTLTPVTDTVIERNESVVIRVTRVNFEGATDLADLTLAAAIIVKDATGICGRTAEVSNAIIARISGNPACTAVTPAQLAAVSGTLSLNGTFNGVTFIPHLNSTPQLKSGDFAGLTGLQELGLGSNALTALPEGVFAGLTSLRNLNLPLNDLDELPEGVFAGLASLQTLTLNGNDLRTLPEDMFAGLTGLQTLWLQNNALTELPAGVFAGLTSLRWLVLSDNALTELPDGVFAGLTSFRSLLLDGNNFTARTATDPGGLPAGIFDDVLDTVTRVATDFGDAFSNGGLLVDATVRLAHSVCSRTAAVRDAIVAAVGGDCIRVSTVQLAAVTTISVSGLSASPRANDLDGLDALTSLTLAGSFTSLPAGIFDSVLGSLVSLSLDSGLRGTASVSTTSVSMEQNASTDVTLALDRSVPIAVRIPLAASLAGVSGEGVIPAGQGTDPGITATLTASQTAAIGIGTFSLGTPVPGTINTETGDFTPIALSGTPEQQAALVGELIGSSAAAIPLTVVAEVIHDPVVRLVADDALIIDTDATDTGAVTLTLTDQPPGEHADVTFNLDDSLATFGASGDYTLAITRSGTAVKQTSSADGVVGDDFVPVASGDQTFRIPADTGSVLFTVTPVADTATEGNESVVIRVTRVNFRRATDVSDLRLAAVILVKDTNTGICGRTAAVRNAIIAAIPGTPACGDVTPAQLAAVNLGPLNRGLDLQARLNSTPQLKSGDFAGLTGLQRLTLYNNALTELPEGVFDGLTSLGTLRLDDNALTTLPAGVFDGLTSLQWLGLHINALTTLPEGVFTGLTSLQTLALGGNALTELPEGVFADLTSLQELRLTSNHLTELPEGVFADLTSLQSLALNGNPLTELPEGVFADLTSLQILELVGNNFTARSAIHPGGLPAGIFDDVLDTVTRVATDRTDAFGNGGGFLIDDTVRLAHFVCSRTDADAIVAATDGVDDCLRISVAQLAAATSPTDICGRTPEVQAAILAAIPGTPACGDVTPVQLASITGTLFLGNRLTSTPKLKIGDFAGLTSLRELALRDNALTELPEGVFAGLTSLQRLWLGNNDLTALPAGVFAGLTSLQTLELARNDLRTLPADVFDGTSLRSLFLHSNNFTARTAAHPGGLSAGIFDDVLDTLGSIGPSFRGNLRIDANVRAAHSVCGRTAAVSAAIATAAGVDCLLVSTTNLAGVTTLSANGLADSPRANDLDGFDALTNLTLAGSFTSLPEGALDDVLDTLTSLTLPESVKATVSITPATSNFVPDTSRNFSATLDKPLPYPLRLALTAGGTLASEITVPASVTIPAGMKYAGFTVSLDAGVTLGDTGTVAPGDPALFYTPESGPEEELAAFIEDALMNAPVALHTLTAAAEASDDSTVKLVASDALIIDSNPNDTATATLVFNDQPAGEYADVTFNLDGSSATLGTGGDYTLAITRGRTAVKQTSSADGIAGADFVPVASGEQTFRIPADTGSVVFTLTPVVDTATEGNESVFIRVTRVNFEGATDLADLTLAARIIVKDTTGICGRTAVVQTIIRVAIPGSPACENVTPAHLAAVNPHPTGRGLNFSNRLNDTPKLKSGDFAGLTGLQTLDLSRNALATLPYGVFADLTSLQELQLPNNALTELPERVFAGLTGLQILRLNNNALTTLPAGVFDGANFQFLDLRSNNFTARSDAHPGGLPAGIFDDLLGNSPRFVFTVDDNVRAAHFVCGRTARVRDAIVAATRVGRGNCLRVSTTHLAAVTEIGLVRASLSALKVNDLAGLDGLQTLDLSFNSLTALPDGVFAGLTSLEELIMFRNTLRTLPAGVFAGLTRLEELRLDRNALATLPVGVFAGLTSLEKLRLDRNSLPTLPAGVFADLTSLEELIMFSNSLSELSSDVFDSLANLTTLDISGNSLTSLPVGIFDTSLGSLVSLTLGGLRGTASLSTTSVSMARNESVDVTVALDRSVPVAVRIPLAASLAGVSGAVVIPAGEGTDPGVTATLIASDIAAVGTGTFSLGTPVPGTINTETGEFTPITLSGTAQQQTALVGRLIGSAADAIPLTITAGDTRLAVSDASATEADGVDRTGEFTLTLTGVDDANDAVFTYALSEGTATETDDYIISVAPASFTHDPVADTITIPAESITATSGEGSGDAAGAAVATITIAAVDDALVESAADETVIISLTSPASIAYTDDPEPDNRTVRVVDDDTAVVSLTGTDVDVGAGTIAVSEGAGSVALQVEITNAADLRRSVDVSLATSTEGGQTAAAGTHYTENSQTLTFAQDDPAQTFTVPILLDDGVVNDARTFTITLSSSDPVTLPAATFTVAIEDDDLVTGPTDITTLAPVTVAEDATGTATIVFDAEVPAGRMVTYTLTPSGTDQATDPDFTADITNPITVALTAIAPANTYTFPVAINDDSLIENSEEATLTVTAVSWTNDGGGYADTTGATDRTATLTITDNEPSEVMSVAASDATEGGGPIRVTVTLNRAATAATTVTWRIQAGTAPAIADADIPGTLDTDRTETINAGSASATFTIDPSPDSAVESTENGIIAVTNVSWGGAGAGFTANATDTFAIADDPAERVSVGVVLRSPTTSPVAEDAGSAGFTVSVSGATLERNVDVRVVTANGTAVAGEDYTAVDQTLTFNAGTTSHNIDVTIADDAVDENEEQFTLNLLNLDPIDTAVAFSPASVPLAIADNDTSGITFNASGPTEGGSDGSFVISFTGAPAEIATVTYQISGNSFTLGEGTGIVTNSLDTVAGTFQIADGQIGGTLLVRPVEDGDIYDEIVTLSITGVTFASSPARPGTAESSLTIADNDTLTVGFASATPAIDEANGSGIMLMVSGGTVTDARGIPTVTITPSAGGATPATAGEDFTDAAINVPINAAATTASRVAVTLPGTNDDIVEDSQTVSLALTATAEQHTATIATGLAAATGTIMDDDALTDVSFAAAGSEVAEGDTATIGVAASGLLERDVDVAFSLVGTNNGDYTAPASVVTLTAGVGSSHSADISIDTTEDAAPEAPEDITLTLMDSGGDAAAYGLGTETTHTLTINDDDVATAISTVSAGDVTEGTATTVTVTLNAPLPTGEVSFNYAVAGVTASAAAVPGDIAAGANNVLATAFVNGRRGFTFTVATMNDAFIESPESARITVSNITAPGVSITATASDDLIINDNDMAVATLAGLAGTDVDVSAGTIAVPEGAGSVTLQVGISNAADLRRSVDVTLTPSTAGGQTAVAGTHYTATSGPLTFAQGDAAQTFTVPIANDNAVNEARTFTITLSSSDPVTLPATTFTVTILDDDLVTGPTDITTLAPVTVAEDATGTATIVFDAEVPAGRTVTYTLTPSGTDQATDPDFTADITNPITVALTAAAPTNTYTFPVAINDDNLIENSEEATLTVTAVNWTNDGGGYADTADAQRVTTFTITDNEPSAVMSVTASDATEGGSPISVTVTLNRAATAATTVTWQIRAGTSPAIADGDIPGTLDTDRTETINAGSASATFTIAPSPDSAVESAENGIIAVTNVSWGGAGAGFTANATDTFAIADDPAERVSVGVVLRSPTTSPVAEDAGSAGFTVSISGATLERNVDVRVVTANGTAVAGEDYTAVDQTLTFNAGTTSHNIDVTIADDAVDENEEQFTLNLETADGAVTLSPVSVSLDITDNDTSGIAINASGGTEGGGDGSFVISFTSAPAEIATVTYGISGNSFTLGESTGIVANSLNTVAGTFQIADGQSGGTLRVTPVEDDDIYDEIVTLSITGVTFASSPARPGAAPSSSLTIADNDTLTVRFASATPAIDETNGSGIMLMVSGGTVTDARGIPTVTITPSAGGATPATAGEDFTAVAINVPINAAATTASRVAVTLPGTNDEIVEDNQTVSLALIADAEQHTATIATGLAAATATIMDDDALTDVSFAAPTSEVVEGDTATIGVAASGLLERDVDVAFALAGTNNGDYTAPASVVTIPAGGGSTHSADISIDTTEDAAPEGPEELTLTLMDSGGDAAAYDLTTTIADRTHILTINDDDVATGIDMVRADNVTEGTATTVTVTLNAPLPTGEVRFNYAVAGVTASAATVPGDIAAGANNVLATDVVNGRREFTFDINTASDNRIENNEEGVRVTVSNITATGVSIAGPASDDFTITDATPGLTVSLPPQGIVIHEADTGSTSVPVTITAETADISTNVILDRAVTVRVSTVADTATTGEDFTAISDQVISFGPSPTADNSFTESINVVVIGDTVADGQENFNITLAQAAPPDSAAVLDISTLNITIVDDDAPTTGDPVHDPGEGEEPPYFVIRLDRVAPAEISVSYHINDGEDSGSAPVPESVPVLQGQMESEPVPVRNGETVTILGFVWAGGNVNCTRDCASTAGDAETDSAPSYSSAGITPRVVYSNINVVPDNHGEPHPELAVTSGVGDDGRITEEPSGDNAATITLTVSDVPPSATEMTAVYELTIRGAHADSGDYITDDTTGSLTTSNISNATASVALTITAAADDDTTSETVTLTITGISFTGASGMNLTGLRLRESVRILDTDAPSARSMAAETKGLSALLGSEQVALVSGLVRQRMDSAPDRQENSNGDMQLSLADQPQDMQDFFSELALESSGEMDSGGSYSLWARGQWVDLSGSPSVDGATFSYDGSITGAGMGVERRSDNLLAGVSLSHFMSDIKINSGSRGEAKHEETVTVVAPYAIWKPGSGNRTFWGTIGAGVGKAKISGTSGAASPGVTLFFAQGGADISAPVMKGVETVLGVSGLVTSKTIDGFAIDDAVVSDVKTSTARGEIDFTAHFPLSIGDVPIRPYIGIASIHDAGDVLADDRHAVELRSGVSLQASGVQVSFEAFTRFLRKDQKLWGVSGEIRYAAPGDGGFSAGLTADHGTDESSSSLESAADLPDSTADGREAEMTLDFDTEYAFAPSVVHEVTPFFGASHANTEQSIGYGLRLGLTENIAVTAETDRHFPDARRPYSRHSLNLRARWGF